MLCDTNFWCIYLYMRCFVVVLILCVYTGNSNKISQPYPYCVLKDKILLMRLSCYVSVTIFCLTQCDEWLRKLTNFYKKSVRKVMICISIYWVRFSLGNGMEMKAEVNIIGRNQYVVRLYNGNNYKEMSRKIPREIPFLHIWNTGSSFLRPIGLSLSVFQTEVIWQYECFVIWIC